MTQCEKLLGYLERNGSITGLECITELGILNYKGRICDLRKDGYHIETVWETVTNASGEKKTFARYMIEDFARQRRIAEIKKELAELEAGRETVS